MFAKLLFAAITLTGFLVKADPNPIVPGEYMRAQASWRVKSGLRRVWLNSVYRPR